MSLCIYIAVNLTAQQVRELSLFKNVVYELNITQGCKKIMLKSNCDLTQLYKVIIEKPTYAGDEMHSKTYNEDTLSGCYFQQ